MSFSKNYFFSSHGLSRRSRHGEWVNITKKMHCSMVKAALSIFDAKLKIALTGVRSRVRESLTKRLITTLYFLLKLTYFLVKSAYRQFKFFFAKLRYT